MERGGAGDEKRRGDEQRGRATEKGTSDGKRAGQRKEGRNGKRQATKKGEEGIREGKSSETFVSDDFFAAEGFLPILLSISILA